MYHRNRRQYKYDRRGQSLLEVLVGVVIGSVLVGAAVFAIFAALQASVRLQKAQSASGLNQELLDKVRSFSASNWQLVAELPKGASTTYFLNASSNELLVLSGSEGVIDTDLTSGLVGHWKFDESDGATAYDASGQNNSGSLAQ